MAEPYRQPDPAAGPELPDLLVQARTTAARLLAITVVFSLLGFVLVGFGMAGGVVLAATGGLLLIGSLSVMPGLLLQVVDPSRGFLNLGRTRRQRTQGVADAMRELGTSASERVSCSGRELG